MFIKRNVSIYDQETGEERLFSVMQDLDSYDEEQKVFASYEQGVTKYDRTDNFKRMNDADILAEKKRSNAGSYWRSAKAGGVGAAIGSGLGAAAGAVAGFRKGKAGKYAKQGAIAGAGVGALLGGGGKLAATHGEREQNRFVNKRLAYAKTQAKRREGRDWVSGNHREGYSYSGSGRQSGGASWE